MHDLNAVMVGVAVQRHGYCLIADPHDCFFDRERSDIGSLIEVDRHRPHQAAGLIQSAFQGGGSAALRLGAPRPPADEDSYRRAVALARTPLGANAFAKAEADGRRLPLEEAIVAALAVDELA